MIKGSANSAKDVTPSIERGSISCVDGVSKNSGSKNEIYVREGPVWCGLKETNCVVACGSERVESQWHGKP